MKDDQSHAIKHIFNALLLKGSQKLILLTNLKLT